MSANHVLLQRLEVSNSTSTVVSFRNIPQTGYTDLKIVVSGRTVRSGTDRSNDFLLTFNDSASGYSRKDLGDSPVRSTGGSSLSNIGRIQMPSDDATANTFGNAEIYIANYTSSQNKAVTIDNVSQDNNTYGPTWLVAGLWSSSTPVYSISLTADQSGTITAGSTFSLYGIAKLGTTPAIAPKALGGDIIANDGEYWYHAFLTTGAFKPRTSLNCDVLVVAGGGGSPAAGTGAGPSGGGGAGGVLSFVSQSLSPISYTCTVGSGGANAVGGDSQFGALTLVKGGGVGGTTDNVGGTGGSGGGSGGRYTSSGGAATSGQGYDGGIGYQQSGLASGGGGGAGQLGWGAASNSGGYGGNGTNSYSSWLSNLGLGVNGYIAGGGGGMSWYSGSGGTGGSGGGGNGASTSTGSASAGTANTGSGGGGSSYGSTGGSGVVIVRYAMA